MRYVVVILGVIGVALLTGVLDDYGWHRAATAFAFVTGWWMSMAWRWAAAG
jgi:hypothetical protein